MRRLPVQSPVGRVGLRPARGQRVFERRSASEREPSARAGAPNAAAALGWWAGADATASAVGGGAQTAVDRWAPASVGKGRVGRVRARIAAAALLALPSLAGTVACRNGPVDERAYVNQVAVERADKDAAFEKSSDPVPENRHGELLPLAYFPIDPSYSAPATLKRSSDSTIVQMPTSVGGTRQMRRAGMLEFMLKAK